ncbi:MAG: ATP-binding protein [Gemmatimonadota bacterium]
MPALQSTLRALSRCTGILVLGVAALGILGWKLGLPSLDLLALGSRSMKPNIAIALLFAGLSLILQPRRRSNRWMRWMAALSALPIVLIGLLTSAEYWLGRSLGIDSLFFRDMLTPSGIISPGRMTPVAAASLLLAGCALLLLCIWRRPAQVSAQVMAMLLVLVSLFALLGYLYGLQALAEVRPFSAMSVQTASMFLIVGLATLAAHPERGLMAVATSASAGGITLRRLLPAAVAIPILLGWLRLLGEQAGLFGAELGIAFVVFGFIMIFSYFVWTDATQLHSLDTERERASAALRDSEERFRATFAQAAVGLAHLGLDGRWLRVNPRLCQILGHDAAQLLDCTSQALTYAADLEADAEQSRRLLAGGVPTYALEKRYVDREGRTVWVNFTASLVRTQKGEPEYVVAIIEDIHERKRVETGLHLLADAGVVLSSKLDFEETLDAFARLAVPAIADWCTVDLSADGERFERVTSRYAHPVRAARMADPAPVSLSEGRATTAIRSVWRAGRSELRQAATGTRAGSSAGAVFPEMLETDATSAMLIPLQARGQTMGVISFATAESGRRYSPADLLMAEELVRLAALSVANARLYREAQDARQSLEGYAATLEQRVDERTAAATERSRELARSNQELEQFAYVASHDLQEPLRMVANFTQLLARRYGDRLGPDADEFIGYALEGVDRMHALIRGLLEFARVRGDELAFDMVDLERTLDDTLKDLTPSIASAGAIITREPLPTLRADPRQMEQLFVNLLSNAIKFRGSAPPQVHVSALRMNGEWLLAIEDNGIGIAASHVDRVFQIFQRLHPRKDYPGTGIGLALCRKIVERHGGRIWVESTPGRGSTFHIALPAA